MKAWLGQHWRQRLGGLCGCLHGCWCGCLCGGLWSLALALWAPAAWAQASAGAWVIGQSLPLSGAGFPIANRIQAGAKALVDRLNASGGLYGRPLELLTLDDAGDPQRHAANLRSLVRERGALAIVNCLGERACLAAAATTRELGVPLVGPLSGALALRAPQWPQVFSLRPDDAREAQALARQLQTSAIHQAVLWADGSEPSREQALAKALQAAGIQLTRVTLEPSQPASLEAALQSAAQAGAQALVLNLGPEGLRALDQLPEDRLAALPALVATLSTAGLTQVTRLFKGHTIGFTSVVPNPEVSQLPLVREFERDVEAFVGPEAMSFEGMASYLHLRLCVEALRRAGKRADAPGQLALALEGMGSFALGGWPLSFDAARHHGSEFVEVGLRGRDGRLRR